MLFLKPVFPRKSLGFVTFRTTKTYFLESETAAKGLLATPCKPSLGQIIKTIYYNDILFPNKYNIAR